MTLPLVLVRGVSGAGESILGRSPADWRGPPFADAGDVHLAANAARRRGGQPLTQVDRWPWPDALASR